VQARADKVIGDLELRKNWWNKSFLMDFLVFALTKYSKCKI